MQINPSVAILFLVLLLAFPLLVFAWRKRGIPSGMTVINHLREGLCVFDAQDRLVAINPSARRILLVGDACMGSKASDILGGFADLVAFPLDGQEYAGDFEKGGRVLEVMRVAVPSARRRDLCKVITLRDVTLRRRADQERAHLRESLIQARKMESVARIAGGIAHDFNNHLMGIMGYAELAHDLALPEQDEIRRFQMQILRVSERSATLVRQLLAYARKQPSLPQRVAVNAAIGDEIAFLQQLVGVDYALEWSAGAGVPDIHVDPAQLDQILFQLVLNAKESMAEAGVIGLCSRVIVVGANPAALRSGPTAGTYACLDVVDSGSGIDPSVSGQLFEPFVSTKGQGRGLGLAMVEGLVKQNKGYVHVERRSDQRTCFTVMFPAMDQDDC